MNLRSVNLNLLPLLQALLREESIGRAGLAVGLSQPAMSEALAKLRTILQDPLLVRVGRSMELTPRAREIQDEVDHICATISSVLRPAVFDPTVAVESFTIAAPDYLAQAATAHFQQRISVEGPGVRVRFVDVSGRLPSLMRSGDIDLAVCGDFDIWPELASRFLFTDRVVCVVSRRHPLATRERITLDEARQLASIGYARDPRNLDQFDTGVPGFNLTAQVSTSRFLDAVLIAAASELAAQVPESLVASARKLVDFAVLELEGGQAGFKTSMFWPHAQTHSQAHMWLRTFTIDCMRTALPAHFEAPQAT